MVGRRSNPKFMSVGQTSRGRRRFALDCIDRRERGQAGRSSEGEKEKWGTFGLSLRGNPRKFRLSFLIGIRTPPGKEGRNRQAGAGGNGSAPDTVVICAHCYFIGSPE